MGGDVRTTVGVPKLSAFANGSGTPLVIDTATGVGYFTDKNTVVPITGGSASGVTSVNGENGVVVLDAADVGAVAKTGDTMTGPLNLAAIQSATGVAAISIAASGVLSFPAMAQSLSGNGYVKLPGGLIIQWGTAQHTSNKGPGWSTAAFPTPFPNGVFQVNGICTTAGPAYNSFYATLVLADIIPAGFSWVLYDKTGTPVPGADVSQFRWIALGH